MGRVLSRRRRNALRSLLGAQLVLLAYVVIGSLIWGGGRAEVALAISLVLQIGFAVSTLGKDARQRNRALDGDA